jgi:hypothetical protein
MRQIFCLRFSKRRIRLISTKKNIEVKHFRTSRSFIILHFHCGLLQYADCFSTNKIINGCWMSRHIIIQKRRAKNIVSCALEEYTYGSNLAKTIECLIRWSCSRSTVLHSSSTFGVNEEVELCLPMGGSREYVHTNQQAPYVRGPDIFVKNIGLLVSIKFGHKIRRGRTLISSYIFFDKSIGFGAWRCWPPESNFGGIIQFIATFVARHVRVDHIGLLVHPCWPLKRHASKCPLLFFSGNGYGLPAQHDWCALSRSQRLCGQHVLTYNVDMVRKISQKK